MSKVTDVFLKISKVIVFALLSVQYIYAVWWVINNIMVVPDFSIPTESFLYGQIASFIGPGFVILYLLQAVALYFGIRALIPENQWVARFAITNPLILQFIFSLTPDVFALSIVLVLMGDLLQKGKIKSKHAFFLVALGILHSRYFLIGLLVLIVMVVLHRRSSRDLEEEQTRKQKLSDSLAVIQILLVVVLIFLSYQTFRSMEDQTLVQKEFANRFTVDETIPSQNSVASVGKGLLEDSVFYVCEPFYSVRIIDDLRLTQNSWNYINFTREEPGWSRAFMEITERNMIFVFLVFVISIILYYFFVKEKKKIQLWNIPFFITCILACILITVTSKRGLDYRNGLLIIPVWYGIILSFYDKIHLFAAKEDKKES